MRSVYESSMNSIWDKIMLSVSMNSIYDRSMLSVCNSSMLSVYDRGMSCDLCASTKHSAGPLPLAPPQSRREVWSMRKNIDDIHI